MNAPIQPLKPRRRIWPWIAGLIVTPFLVGGLMVWNLVRLSGEAARLRDALMAASGSGWHTRIQMTLNPLVVAAVRTGVGFVHDLPEEARLGLRVVRSVSLGVYVRPGAGDQDGRPASWAAADRTMRARGWTRLVGVAEPDGTVLIYVPVDETAAQPSRICLAVCHDRELVVVAGRVRAEALAALAGRELGTRLPHQR
jgi:hypothetical protein